MGKKHFGLGELALLIRDAAVAFNQDKAPRLAAALAYYSIFSISPLLLFAVAIAGRFLADKEVIEGLVGASSFIAQSLGLKTAEFLKSMIPSPESLNYSSVSATALGFTTLFMGATGLFVQLKEALDSLWGTESPSQNWFLVIRSRILSFALVIMVGFLLLGFLALNTYISAVARGQTYKLGIDPDAVRLVSFGLSVVFLTFIFAAIFKLLPAVKLQWREVWLGGAVTAVLFTAGQFLIGIYFGRTAPSSVYGAAGALALLLLWIYYSAMIFLFGAEITWVYSQRYGTHAGGASNHAKRDLLEVYSSYAAENTEPDVPKPKKRRLFWVITKVPSHAQGRILPTIRGAIWNAVTAVFAIPVIVVLRILGITGGRH